MINTIEFINYRNLDEQLHAIKTNDTITKIIKQNTENNNLYQLLSKVQSKNLMFTEFIIFLIEKGFVKNKHKLHYYLELYDSINNSSDGKNNNHIEDQKFNKKKFETLLNVMAKQFYPCDELGLQHIFQNFISNAQQDDVRIKIDENIKKILTRQLIKVLKDYERQLEIIYEIYLPQNYNGKLNFSWQQIKFLEKKLPIICVFRFLWDSQICPIYFTPTNFLQIASKLIPPYSLLTKTGQKQSAFYSSETIINYSKDCMGQKKIKLLDGDIGVSFFQFQMLLIRLSIDLMKQKNDIVKAFENLVQLLNLKQLISIKGQTKAKPNKFQENIRNYFEEGKRVNKNNFQVKKRQTKKKIQQILQCDEKVQQDSRNQFKDSNITLQDLIAIKKNLDDDHMPQIPQKPIVEKENNSSYKIQQKNIVIGTQLPKLPEKNNSTAAVKKNDKKDELVNKFKFQQHLPIKLSTDYTKQLIKVAINLRVNNQVPIILMDIVYPNDIPNIYINPKSEIFLETTFIHLSQRSYQKAFINYVKARTLCENIKNQTTQFFFLILQAQIYEAAARDGMALLNYHKAKELAQNMLNKDFMLKYIAYKGLGCCLYHVQEYQYALRCFLKARQLRIGQIQLESVQNGVLENNIGCIYMIMNRNNQAMKHLALSEKIMDLKLGKFNQRSVIVQQNQRKNKKAYIQMLPTYKTMWKTYVQKPNLKQFQKPKKN